MDLTAVAEKEGALQEVKDAVSCLTDHADDVLEGYNNNPCEQFNSVINKFVGGKRVFHGQRYGYSMRIKMAAISWNSGEYIRVIHKACGDGTSPGMTGP